MNRSTASFPGSLLIITRYFPPAEGGTEAYSYQLAKGLTELGEDVIVVAPRVADWEDFDRRQNFSIVRFQGGENRAARLRRMYFTTRRLLKKKTMSAIIATTWSPAGVVAWLLGGKNRVPYYVIVLGTELYAHRFWNRLRDRVLASAAGLIAISNFTRQRLLRAGVVHSRVSIVHPAIDIRKFQQAVAPPGERVQVEIPTLLTVTRLTPKKGVDTVLRALPKVKDRIRDLRYIIVGGGEDRERLKKITRDLDLSGVVRFAGRVSDEELIGYYQQCDLFVLASREEEGGADYEGFGIVFLEAAACGKPVVGGRSGGIPEAVEDGVSGILVDPYNKEDLSRAILTLLTDRPLSQKMGEAGRRRVEEKFNYVAQARAVKEILR